MKPAARTLSVCAVVCLAMVLGVLTACSNQGSSSASPAAASSNAASSVASPSSAASTPSVPSSASSSSASNTPPSVSASGTVSLTLDFNAGTGYEWRYSADNEGVLELVDQSTSSVSDAPVAGGAMHETFTFHAAKAGEVVLTFELKRSWEAGEEPAETQTYGFTVNEGGQIILNPYKSNFVNEPVWK